MVTNLPASGESSQIRSSLTDPVTFGEDLAFNLQAASDLADKYCGSCRGYHLLHVGKRLVPLYGGINLDRQDIAATLAKLAEVQLAARESTLEVVIAGSADTGLLACAAHGIASIGEPALSRCRFTVLDRCRTPLELCRQFGRIHHLNIETEVVEFVEDTARRVADLVVIHSLFRFIPRPAHVDLLRKIGGWLRPGGRILFSAKLDSDESGEAFERRQRDFGADVAGRVRDGQFQIGAQAAAFNAGLDRRSVKQTTEYADLAALQTLFDRAELPVLATRIVSGEAREEGRQATQYRAVAILGPPASSGVVAV